MLIINPIFYLIRDKITILEISLPHFNFLYTKTLMSEIILNPSFNHLNLLKSELHDFVKSIKNTNCFKYRKLKKHILQFFQIIDHIDSISDFKINIHFNFFKFTIINELNDLKQLLSFIGSNFNTLIDPIISIVNNSDFGIVRIRTNDLLDQTDHLKSKIDSLKINEQIKIILKNKVRIIQIYYY